VKTLNPLKVPFGKAKFSRLRNVRYLQWEDAFEVDFDDGLSFLEPHKDDSEGQQDRRRCRGSARPIR
jgi:hypothetical protein